MPLTLHVGISKKHGLPDYGSVGAICNLTVELDASLLTQDLDGFRRHVHNAYAACARAVNEELARHKPNSSAAGNGRGGGRLRTSPGDDPAGHDSRGNGKGQRAAAGGNGRGPGNESQETGPRASESQLRYVNRLARGIGGLGPQGAETLSVPMFGKPLADLSSLDASRLIDTLKAIREDRVSLDEVLNDRAPP
jgi:hypothetical protein